MKKNLLIAFALALLLPWATRAQSDCTPISTFPVTYGFEASEGFTTTVTAASACTTNVFSPCWRNEQTSFNATSTTTDGRIWHIYGGTTATQIHTGTQSLMLPDKGSTAGVSTTMLTFPAMDFTSPNGYVVSFWIYRNGTGTSTPEGIKIYASDTDTIGPNAVELGHYSRHRTMAYPSIESASGWYQYETSPITLTGTVYIIFEGQSYYSSSTYIDDVVIMEAPTCTKPFDVTLEGLSHNEATISWSHAGNANGFFVYYDTLPNVNTTTAQYEIANDTVVTLTNLNPLTTYYYVVVADCGGNDFSLPTVENSFTTHRYCGDGVLNINDAVSYGTSSAYTQMAYNYNSTSYALGHSANIFTAEEMIELGLEGAGTINAISLHAGSTATTVPIRVYIGKTALTSFSTAAADTVGMMSHLTLVFDDTLKSTANEWVSLPFNTPYEYAPDSSLIIYIYRPALPVGNGTFYYTSTSPEYKSFYGYRSSSSTANLSYTRTYNRNDVKFDICYQQPTCFRPSDVVVDTVTETTIELSWTGCASADSYIVTYNVAGADNVSSEITFQSSILLENLLSGTVYNIQIRSICGTDTTFAEGVTAATRCADITVLPYTENFEGAEGTTSTTSSVNNLPPCWSNHNVGTNTSYSGYPIVYNSSANAHGGNQAMRFYTYITAGTYADQYAIMPMVDSTIYPMNTLKVDFWMRSTSTSYSSFCIVGVMTDPTDASTFVPIETVPTDASTTYEHHEVMFGSYEGPHGYITFKFPQPTSSYNAGLVDDVTIDLMPSCPPVTNLRSDNVYVDWANIVWTAMGEASAWVVEYDSVDFTPGSGANAATVYDTTYMMTGLDTGATYYVYVRSDCGGDTSYFVGTTVRTLAALPAEVPYSCDFEGNGTNGWDFIDDAQNNYWMVGSATNNGGSQSLYITDNGTANNYSGTASYSFAVRTFSLVAGNYICSYDWKAQGEGSYDFLRVALVPASTNIEAGAYCGFDNTSAVPDGGIALDGAARLNLQGTTWNTRVEEFNVASDGAYKLVFLWRNDVSVYNQPPAAIDNVSLALNACPIPTGLMATNVTTNSITVTWQPGGNETSWQVSNGTETVMVYDTTYTFEFLNSNTNYSITVASVCGSGDTSMAISSDVRTDCGSLTLPYFENFDGVPGATSTSVSTTNLPPCWSNYNEGTSTSYSGYPIVYNAAASAYSGSQFMRFYTYYTAGTYADQYGIMPITDSIDSPVNSLLLSFWMRTLNSGTNSWCVVGVLPNPQDISTFVPVDSLYTNSSDTYHYYEVNFSGYTGPHGNITFRFPQPSTGYNYGYVDDITLGPIPECPYVDDLTASNITTTGFTVSWTDNLNTGWNIEYDTVEFTPGAGHMNPIHVTDLSCVLTGLIPSTGYVVYVYPDCPDGVFARQITVSTASMPATVPYSCNFEATGLNGWDLLTDGQHNYWMVGNATGNTGRSLYVTNDGSANSYTVTTISYSYAVRNIQITDTGEYVYSFDWKCQGEGNYDFVRALFVPDSVNIVAGVLNFGTSANNYGQTVAPAPWIDLTGKTTTPYGLNLQNTWQTRIGVLHIVNPGTYKLVFAWVNDGSGGTQPPAAIDNISLKMNTCSVVDNVVANVSGNIIDLSWTPGGSEASWAVTVGTNTTVVNTPAYSVTGLTTNTDYAYSIRAICGAGDTSFAITGTLHTPCDAVAVPYSENFDSYTTSTTAATGVQVPCWPYIMTGSATYQAASYQPQVYYSSTNAHSGSYSLRLYGESYTMLPPMSVPLDSLQLTFWDYTSGASYLLEVGVMEGNTFVPVQTITTAASTHAEHTVYFANYTGTSRIIAFRNHNTSATSYLSYHYIDNVEVSYRPTCTPVIDIQSLAIGTDSLTVDWTDLNTASLWQVSIVSATGTGTTTTVTSHPVTFTGLTPNTDYNVSVRPICSATDTGEVTSAFFHTRCLITTLPYTENFDSYTTSTTAATGVEVPCWDAILTGPATYQTGTYVPQIYYSTSYGHSSTYSYRLYGMGYHMLPPMPVPLDSLQLTFWDYTTSASYGLEVGVMEDTVFVPIQTIVSPVSTHMEHTVYFGNYTGTSRVIAFRNYYTTGSTTYYSYHYLDDVVVDYLPSCPPVVGLTATDATTSSITIDWTDQIAAGSWEVEYTGNGTTNTVVVTSHPTTLNGLTVATAYQLRVRPLCSATDTGEWCLPANAQTDCDLITPPYYQNFDAVTGTTYSTAGVLPPCWEGYSNGTNAVYAPHVVGSGTYWYCDSANALGMTSGSETYGNTKYVRLPQFTTPVNTMTMSFWMSTESNANGYLQVGYMTSLDTSTFVAIDSIHASATTHHGTGTGTSANGVYDTVDFTSAPSTAQYIAFKWVYTTSFYSCFIDNVEVTSTGAMVCHAPIVDTIFAGETEVTLNWQGGAANYEVAAVAGSWVEPASGTPVTGLTATLTGLTPGTPYAVGVRAVCAEDLYSEWVVNTVTTLAHPCYAPTDVAASNVQLSSATITWTPFEASQTNFEVRYSTGGDTTALTVEGTSADLTGLHHSTEYSVAVRAICGEGNYSDWSAPATFRTASCTGVSDVRVSNETVEGATVTWSGNSGAQAYEVAYGLPGVDQNQCTRQRVTATTYTITGLDDATTYVVYVRSECETGVYSDWSEGVTFTTETVGIDDVDSESISLYPNPASSTVTLTGIEGEATVTVVDMNGRELYKLQTTNSQLTIDVSQLSQGAYFVRITGERVNAIRKLIVR